MRSYIDSKPPAHIDSLILWDQICRWKLLRPICGCVCRIENAPEDRCANTTQGTEEGRRGSFFEIDVFVAIILLMRIPANQLRLVVYPFI